MPEQQTPDFRKLISEYVAGEHRPTRHTDICLDPVLADKIEKARDARDQAKHELDDVKDSKANTMGNSPKAAAKRAATAAEKALGDLTEQASGCSVRLVFMGMDADTYSAFGRESRAEGRTQSDGIDNPGLRDEEAGRIQFAFESSELPKRILHKVTTVDDRPTDITVEQGRQLLATLGTGDIQRCYLAAIDACTTSVDLPF